ncbi:DUF4395 domain-containing protein [Natronosporangium hydrolyticum]|uniref:DUF4395 domain-containing protein n=1 Tax=Natronosporangium hydrolyticum TaxID=2811111 RepID=A0A895YQY6_9ACTN|nr:DUF4395 domain-containing protein [Natronosporangium hydrolyticum]
MLDPRGVRFTAAITSLVLVVVLVTGWGYLALAQAAVFAVTAASPSHGPYALLYRALVRRWLGPPAAAEPAAPVRFAQLVGLAFILVAAVGYLSGWAALGLGFTAAALAAAFLNAAFGLCLGCEVYLAARRVATGSSG